MADERHIVIAADIAESRQLSEADRAATQKKLAATVEDLSRSHAAGLRTRFHIAAGDSFQAVLADPAVVPDVMWDVWNSWKKSQIRFGVGYGAIYTPFDEDSRLMDGPAFHDAVAAAASDRDVGFRGFGKQQDSILSGLGAMLRTLFDDVTPRQLEVIGMARRGESQTSIASALGISKQAVSQHLRAAGWQGYRDGEDALRQALVLFTGAEHVRSPRE